MTLDLAKIGSISRELKPLSPGEKGMVGFKRSLYGISDRIRQHRRDVTLAAVGEDLQQAASRLAQSLKTSGRRTVLAGKELLEGLQGQAERQPGDQATALGNEFGAPVLRRIGR
jgi:Zn-dependent M16 (insulinase) family peptidase